jgi:hypothetical protein
MTAVTTSRPATVEDRLRAVLRLDSVVTGLAGLFAVVGPTSAYGDGPGWLPRLVGVGFVLAALGLAMETRQTGSRLITIGAVCSAAAFAWTAVTVVLLLLVDLPPRGQLVLALVGLATLAFAVAELRVVRTLRAAVTGRAASR